MGPEADGYIFIGVTDSKNDAERVKSLDRINPIEINGRYIVGIDREALLQNKTLEQYVKVLTSAIIESELTNPLKTQLLTKFDTILYKGYSVIRITIPAQNEISFIGDKSFIRKDSSTVEIKGKELLAISQIFQKPLNQSN